jgi:hypothetical protein
MEEAIKALYAVSALIRNNLAGQGLFFAEAGDIMLQVTYIGMRKKYEIIHIVLMIATDSYCLVGHSEQFKH